MLIAGSENIWINFHATRNIFKVKYKSNVWDWKIKLLWRYDSSYKEERERSVLLWYKFIISCSNEIKLSCFWNIWADTLFWRYHDNRLIAAAWYKSIWSHCIIQWWCHNSISPSKERWRSLLFLRCEEVLEMGSGA